jgi:hypothetical protein
MKKSSKKREPLLNALAREVGRAAGTIANATQGLAMNAGFHMADFESPYCKLYAGWSSDKKRVFLYQLINLLRTRTRMFFAVLVPMYE